QVGVAADAGDVVGPGDIRHQRRLAGEIDNELAQVLDLEGLGDEGVDAPGDGLAAYDGRMARGHDHDRDEGAHGIVPDAPIGVDAVEPAQVEVEKHARRPVLGD